MTNIGTWVANRPLEFGKGNVIYVGEDFEIIQELGDEEVMVRLGTQEFTANLKDIKLSAVKRS